MITIAVAAEGYSPQTVETELFSGELAEVSVNLSPLLYTNVNVSTVDNTAVYVYQGALYVGEAPLTLRMPIDMLNYVMVESQTAGEARAVFTTPDMPEEPFNLTLRPKIMPPPGQKRVNKARTRSYWAWGGVWVTGIAAWLTNGLYTGLFDVAIQNRTEGNVSSANTMYYVSTGAVILLGTAVANYLFQMSRYLYTASENVTPIVRQEKTAQ
jgi:hypothetical protein